MSFVLGGTTLPNPTNFQQGNVVTGDYNTTMRGNVRRSLKAKKKVYSLAWSQLSMTEYNNIKDEYNKNTTLSFTNTDLDISATVHMDMSSRDFVAGTGNKYISGVEITLQEI